jgi:hypothetical protein
MALNQKPSPGNMGGVLKIAIYEVDKVSNDSPDNFTGSEALRIYFTEQTAGFDEPFKDDDHGGYYQPKVDFIIPKIRAELIDYLVQNRPRYFVLVVQTANELTYRVGSKNQPLALKVDLKHGRKRTERSQIDFEFSTRLMNPSPEIIDYLWL